MKFNIEMENYNMDGIKRLQEMIKGQKDKYLNIIVNYLVTQIELNQYFLNEQKNLKNMAKYIKDKARKQASGNVAVIEDEMVYQWAKEYFIKSDDELGINKTESAQSKDKDISNTKIKDEEDEFGSIFEDNTEKQSKENKEGIEQISLFAA